MKINRMLTALVLSVISWLVAISGLATSGYLIFKGNELNSLLIGFLILLGSLLLAAVVRMVGNIGQMLFDLRVDIQNQATSLTKALQEVNASLSGDLQALFKASQALSQDAKQTNDILSKGFLSLNQNLKTQLQEFNHSLSNDLEALKDGLTTLSQDNKETRATLSQNFQELNRSLSKELQNLKNNLEQISCDSKDINQNIHQIETFFEQIERHLDLKK